MLIIPSLYLKDGQVVKPVLPKDGGKSYGVISDDPVDMAGRWMDRGARRLHIVDVDGALSGVPVNNGLIAQIATRFPNFSIQVGGGIRTLEAMDAYIKSGVDYLVLTTSAVENPELIEEACAVFPEKIVIGIEEYSGELLVSGSAESSSVTVAEMIERYKDKDIASFLYSDLSSEEKGQGINLKAMVDIASQASVPVELAGGISAMEDIKALAAQAFKGINGVVVGQALYDGALDLLEAQHYCDNAHRYAM